jgi:hypothetical protein
LLYARAGAASNDSIERCGTRKRNDVQAFTGFFVQ